MTKFDVVKCQSPYTNQKHNMWYVMEKTGPRRYLQGDGTLDRNTHWFVIRETARAAIKKFRQMEDKPEVRTAKVNITIGRDNSPMYVRFFISGTHGFSYNGTEPCYQRSLDDALVAVGKVLGMAGVTEYKVERIPF